MIADSTQKMLLSIITNKDRQIKVLDRALFRRNALLHEIKLVLDTHSIKLELMERLNQLLVEDDNAAE